MGQGTNGLLVWTKGLLNARNAAEHRESPEAGKGSRSDLQRRAAGWVTVRADTRLVKVLPRRQVMKMGESHEVV